jgi:preprotein translocase subunit YajC
MRRSFWTTSALSMILMAAPVLSQAKEGVAPPTGSFGGIIPMMLIMFAIIYFLMIRPEQKKSKDRKAMMEGLKKGDKIITIGGIMGTVHSVKDASVIIRVADNTNIEFTRAAIANIMKDEKPADKTVKTEEVKEIKDTKESKEKK